MQNQVQMLIRRLKQLSREHLDEVAAFIDVLRYRNHENNLWDSFSATSEASLRFRL